MTSPTPPIELRGTSARWSGAVDVPAEVIDALRGVCAVVEDEAAVADASRDWWPLAPALGAGRRGAGAGRRARPPGDDGRGRRRRAHLRRRPGAAHRRRRSQRCFRGVGSRSRRRARRPHRPGGNRRGGHGLGHRRGPRRDVRTGPGDRAAAGPPAQRRALPAELRPRDRGRMGGLPGRRPVLHALRQGRGPRRRPRGRARRRDGRAHRRCSGRRGRARSLPALPRFRGHARRDHEGLAAGTPPAGRGATGGVHVPVVRPGHRGLPDRAPTWRDACGAAPVRRDRGRAQPPG